MVDQFIYRITWVDGTTQEEYGVSEADIRQFCARAYPDKEISKITEI